MRECGKHSRVVVLTLTCMVLSGSASRGFPAEPPAVRSDVSHDGFALIAKDIEREVGCLGYSHPVAQEFVDMVREWDLAAMNQQLAQTRADHRDGRLSKDQMAQVEKDSARTLIGRIRQEIAPSWKDDFDLADVLNFRMANCLGNSQLFWILGNSLGLKVQMIVVLEPAQGNYPRLETHIACLAALTDGKTIMVDARGFGSSLAERSGDCVSEPFNFVETFAAVGDYYEIRNRAKPMHLHRKVQVVADTRGIHALLVFSRGSCHLTNGDNAKAIAECTEAIRLNPKYFEAYLTRGCAYDAKGDYDKAIADCSAAIRLNPVYEAYYLRGCAYDANGDHAKAIAECTEAIRLNPKYAEAYYLRGSAYATNGEYAKAIADINKAAAFAGEKDRTRPNR
jgi:tetratricopeptide (TPR) repeat protein